MTKKIFTVEDIQLQNWESPVRIHPLTIKGTREVLEFIDQAGKPKEGEEEDERTFLDLLLEAGAMCMATFEPKLKNPKKLENHIDVGTLEYLLEIAVGLKLNDPNLKAAVAATDGKNF